MRPLKGTMKMAVKFELLTKRRATGHFRPVHAGDLGRWSSPRNPTLGQLPGDIWNIDHPVFGIGAPAYYRFRVSFRWTDSTGKVLGLVVRRSPVCFQPELRPDLLVRQFIVGPASSGQNRYTAVIHNRGVSAAGPFDVELEGAGPTQTQSFAGLGPRQTVRVTFIGDVCASAGPVTVTVDPGHLVDDYDRRNNTSTAACSTAPNARRPTLHSVKQ
jgi:hypothetical protein